MPAPPAPAVARTHLVGAWRRTLLVRPDGSRDTGTSVTWLQASSLYVDTRGFAGRLQEDAGAWVWERLVDPRPTGADDAGHLHREGDLLVETGRDEDYLEHWRRLPGDDAPVAAALLGGHGDGPVVVVRVGARAAWATPDAVVLAELRDGAWTPAPEGAPLPRLDGRPVHALEGDLSDLPLEGLPA